MCTIELCRKEGLPLQSAPAQPVRDTGWIMDSGASDHMCCRREWFITYEAFDHPAPVCIPLRKNTIGIAK